MNSLQYAVISFSIPLILLSLGWGLGVMMLGFLIVILGFYKRYIWRSMIGVCGAVGVWYLFLLQQELSAYSTGSFQSLSGLVVATTKRTAFVLQDNVGNERYITHKNTIDLGDRVEVRGYVTAAKQFEVNFTNILHFLYSVELSPLVGSFDYPAWLTMKGYRGSLSSFEVDKQENCVECLPWWNRSVIRLIQEVERWWGDTEQAGLLLGLLVGHRGMLSKQTNDQFSESGLIHVIAVSGGNLVMIASLLGLLLFRLPVYMRFGVVGIGLCLYGLLCGFDSSVVRALIMAILGLIAIFLGRPTLSRRILTLTYIGMLCWNPLYLLYDLGFQLSFMAVVGILLFQEKYGAVWDEYIQHRKKSQKSFFRGVWSHLLVSGGAFLFTLPILFLAMGKVNITGLLSNILIVPFIPLLQIGGFISTWTSEWIESQGVVLWMLDMLIAVARRTQDYGVQIVIEEVWVKWVMVGLWGVGVCVICRKDGERIKFHRAL